MKYECKAVKYAAYCKGDNPVFGDSVITVSLEDEAGGPFLVLSSTGDRLQHPGTIELDFEQWVALDKAARQLMKDFDYE